MPALTLVSAPLDDAARGARVYAGDILIFRRLPAMAELCRAADRLLREAFGGREPTTAHQRLPPPDYDARRRGLRPAFAGDGEVQRLLAEALRQTGADDRRCYRDRAVLRAQPPARGGRAPETLGVHRDTWGSNLMAQHNWWAPVYPLSRERTIALYPAYWSRPLANTSAEWDLEELRARRRRDGTLGGYPLLPEAAEPVDTAAELRVVIEPGDLMCFSGAHLHASVPNGTALARFSIETRSVDVEDVRAGRGAPNLDGAAPRVATGWFRRLADGRPLDEALAEAGRPGLSPPPTQA